MMIYFIQINQENINCTWKHMLFCVLVKFSICLKNDIDLLGIVVCCLKKILAVFGGLGGGGLGCRTMLWSLKNYVGGCYIKQV